MSKNVTMLSDLMDLENMENTIGFRAGPQVNMGPQMQVQNPNMDPNFLNNVPQDLTFVNKFIRNSENKGLGKYDESTYRPHNNTQFVNHYNTQQKLFDNDMRQIQMQQQMQQQMQEQMQQQMQPQQIQQMSPQMSPQMSQEIYTQPQTQVSTYSPRSDYPENVHEKLMKNELNCVEILKHVKECEICGKLYKHDNNVYLVIIGILVIVCLFLFSKLLYK